MYPIDTWPPPPPTHQATVNQMTPLHNPFSANVGSLVFHYDFLSLMNQTFKFYGYLDNGYFRLNNCTFYLVREPALVMMKEKFTPQELECEFRESKMKWVLTEDFIGLMIQSTDTNSTLIQINFLGEVTVREPVTKPEPPSTQVTIWDLFSDRSC